MRPDCSTGKHALRHFVTAILTPLLAVMLAEPAVSQPDATGADCGCLWEGSFSEVASKTDLVLMAEVQATKGNAVDLVPEQILRGELWLDTLRVWMQTRNYCRPPADDFPVGSRWIMALSQIQEIPEGGFDPSTPNQSFGRPYDYTLSSCGGYWLRVNGNTATGNLVPGMPRFYHQPDMSPVLVDLVAGYLKGSVSTEALVEASRERPEAVDELILDTRSFLRGQTDWLPDEETHSPADAAPD
jgi:hypothetical protein